MRYLLAIVVVGLVAYFLTGVRLVKAGERLVVRRFGRVLEHKPEPGLWVGLPWGMDRVDRVSVDLVRRVAVGYRPDADALDEPAGQLLTGDHNLVNVQVMIDYSVRDGEVTDYVIEADRVDALVGRATEAALAEWVAGRRVDDVLLTGKANLPRWLVPEIQGRIDPYHLGVQVQQVVISQLLPPERVKEAFDEVTRSEAEIRTLINNAEQEANRARQDVLAEKYRLEQSTAPYVRDQIELARKEADDFEKRLRLGQNDPALRGAHWMAEMERLLNRLASGGNVMMFDPTLSSEGLEYTIPVPFKQKR